MIVTGYHGRLSAGRFVFHTHTHTLTQGSIWQLLMKWAASASALGPGEKGQMYHIMYVHMIWWCDGSYVCICKTISGCAAFESTKYYCRVQRTRMYVVTDHCIIQVHMIKHANIPYIPLSFFFLFFFFLFSPRIQIDIKSGENFNKKDSRTIILKSGPPSRPASPVPPKRIAVSPVARFAGNLYCLSCRPIVDCWCLGWVGEMGTRDEAKDFLLLLRAS